MGLVGRFDVETRVEVYAGRIVSMGTRILYSQRNTGVTRPVTRPSEAVCAGDERAVTGRRPMIRAERFKVRLCGGF